VDPRHHPHRRITKKQTTNSHSYQKASQAVKEGDIIEVTFGNRPIKVKVLSDIEPRTKDVAREMYEIISE